MMMNRNPNRIVRNLTRLIHRHICVSPSSPFSSDHHHHEFRHFISHSHVIQNSTSDSFSTLGFGFHHNVNLPVKPSSSIDCSFVNLRRYSTINTTSEDSQSGNPRESDETNDEVEPIDLWEEEDEAVPMIGDGGDGGGVVLQNCPWGDHAISIARDVLLQFGDDIEIFAFKTSPRGYIYVRLDRLCNEYGCPSMGDLQSYSKEYKKRLDEAGADGEIPTDLALEVSSPGADRLLRIPDDLQRFKDMAMRVQYVEGDAPRSLEKNGVFFLESIETESEICIWRLADVKENRDPSSKGRPLSRIQKDYRLKLPFETIKQVTLYLDYQ